MKSKFSLVLVGSFLVLFAVSGATNVARADWLIDRSGSLVEVDGYVLGDDSTEEVEVEQEDQKDQSDESSDDSSDDSNGNSGNRQMEQAREMAKDQLEQDREEAKQRLEVATEARIKSQEIRQESIKSKLETKAGEVMQIKQEIKDKTGRVVRRIDNELESGEKVRVEREDGKFLEFGSDGEGRLEIMQERFKTRTNLDISLGENNELIITRPDGTEKIVSVLPDTAADNLRERGYEVLGEEVELDDEGETPVYHFQTQQEKRFLGLFRRTYNQETTISAETGEVVDMTSSDQSPFARFLESLSF